MNPAPRPRRPRPTPGPAVAQTVEQDHAGTGQVDADTIPALPAPGASPLRARVARIPGRLAALRRDPANARRASVAAIGAGAALFVVASVSAPLAGADIAAPAPPATNGTVDLLALLPTSTNRPDTTAPVPGPTVDRKAPKAKDNAPVDHGAISALAANGIPKTALNAYRVAAARLGNVEPGCGIHWSLLAGIGREESDHGRFAGATLHADGTSTPRIVGPALDGKRWDFIPAPANGLELDGDATYAHALGPMQFIPSTWAGYGADATGDGKADIFNINDAALGSARYLCAAGGDLRTQAGKIRAVLAYNHNDQYLAQVLALADAYKHGVPVRGIPVGNISGKLPKVADTGVIPPANPGAPTAADRDRDKTKGTGAKGTGAKGTTSAGKSGATSSSARAAKPKPKPSSTGRSGGGSGAPSSPAPTQPGSTTPRPGSSSASAPSTPAPSPTKTCNAIQKALDDLRPPDQRECI